MSDRQTPDPHERLADLIEAELELVRAGRFDELVRAVEACGAVFASLPEPADPAAAAALARAAALHEQVVAETEQAREQLRQSLVRLREVRHAADGYRPPRRRRYDAVA